jgi:hypothetical protein
MDHIETMIDQLMDIATSEDQILFLKSLSPEDMREKKNDRIELQLRLRILEETYLKVMRTLIETQIRGY